MGLQDREYMRAQPGRGPGVGGFFRVRRTMLSMTTWLIIINVAVFVIDYAVEQSGHGVTTKLGTVVTAPGFKGSYSELVENPNGSVVRSSRGPGVFEVELIDKRTGERAGARLFSYMGVFKSLGYFSTVKITELEVWRFVTFQFLHANSMHLLMNMVGLFFFGPIAEQYLKSRRLFLAFYLMCGIAGAFLYLLLNLIGWIAVPQGANVPLVLANQPWLPLVGASAGVFGVLWAAAFLRAKDIMLIFGVIPMQIRVGVILFTVIAFVNLLTGGSNAGGDAAHIGGAIAGAFFIRKPHLLLDFFDEFMGTSKRHAPFKKRGGKQPRKTGPARTTEAVHEKKLNAILDKVKRRGMGALSPGEQRFLERESERRGGGAG